MKKAAADALFMQGIVEDVANLRVLKQTLEDKLKTAGTSEMAPRREDLAHIGAFPIIKLWLH